MSRRQFHIDAAKVVASNLIVLHHFTVYGPLAEALDVAAPRLTDWFFEYARMAVQVFLVIGGFFAVSALAPNGALRHAQPWRAVAQRYVRLVPPFAAALLLVVVASAVTRRWLDADFIPAEPGFLQSLAHVALLHSVLGVEPLSIGIWYVAIDFQLFATMAALLWAGSRKAQWLVAGAMLASLFYFNLQLDSDNWAPYFFGAYAMGGFAWWAGQSRHAGKWLAALAVVGVAALAWDFRLRIALALVTALCLGLARAHQTGRVSTKAPHPALTRLVGVLARCSYALFLTHFVVLMLVNAAWAHMAWKSDARAGLVTLCAWAACIALALLFERFVERPLAAIRMRV